MTTVTDGDIEKLIVAARTHEDSQVVRGQNGIADDIVVECQIERNAGTGIVVQIKLGEPAVLSLITGQAVKLVVERRKIPHRQPPHNVRGDQAT